VAAAAAQLQSEADAADITPHAHSIAAPTMTRVRRPRNSCPRCGEALLRQRRRPEDRQRQLAVPARRYSWPSAECGWQGLVPISLDLYGRRQRRTMARWPLQPWMLGTLVTVLAMACAGYGVHRLHRAGQLTPGLAAGESHDGVPLPGNHPLRRQLAAAAAASAAAAAGATPAVAVAVAALASVPAAASVPVRQATWAGTTLELRQGCAWGQPGRSPYRGTVEEALHAARVPADVVRQIAFKVKARDVVDRVRISTGSIRGVAGGREFEPKSIAMSFGRTLCLQTRVNFAPGHVEEADLYEASDGSGRKYSVMVPDVCGNVSVLGARGEREDPLLMGADGRGGGGAMAGDPAAVREVPEPGSLLSALSALLVLWVARRWRRRSR
jgi:hypothetical protein